MSRTRAWWCLRSICSRRIPPTHPLPRTRTRTSLWRFVDSVNDHVPLMPRMLQAFVENAVILDCGIALQVSGRSVAGLSLLWTLETSRCLHRRNLKGCGVLSCRYAAHAQSCPWAMSLRSYL